MLGLVPRVSYGGRMEAMDRLVDMWHDAQTRPETPNLHVLGDLHKAILDALDEVREALVPAIVAGSRRDMTYVELATASGYKSITSIVKVMREAGASVGRGRKLGRR